MIELGEIAACTLVDMLHPGWDLHVPWVGGKMPFRWRIHEGRIVIGGTVPTNPYLELRQAGFIQDSVATFSLPVGISFEVSAAGRAWVAAQPKGEGVIA
jgi:hypothetical protein